MARIIPAGSEDVSVELYIIDSTDGTPDAATFESPGIDLWYHREGEAVVSITEIDLTTPALTDAHEDGGFLAVGHGSHRLDLPDAACAVGVQTVTVGGTITGMIVLPYEIQLEAVPADVTHWLGTAAATPTVAGVPEVDLTHAMGTALTEGAGGQLAGGIIKFFDMAAPTGTVNSLPDAVAGAAGGVFIAGTNAATVITGSLTTTFTGNLTGSAASVSGAVGSVTGAVGSVTGAVGSVAGNVDGSVASVVGAVGSVTGAVGSVAGNVDGSVASVVGAVGSVAGNVDGSVASVVGAVGSVTGAVASVTGAVGSVTGAVGSVTGAVGSVAGNVDGNVTGSTASVVGAVGSVTGNVGGNVTGTIGELAAQAKADVNAEMLDVLTVDTFAEPGQENPPATTTLAVKLGYTYKFSRNDITQTATELNVLSDDGVTVDQQAPVSDDGTTYARGKLVTGP